MEHSKLRYRKRFLLLLAIIIGLQHSGAQTDSLRELIMSLPAGQEKADKLEEMGKVYFNAYDYDSAYHYYREEASLSGRIGYQKGLANAWYQLSVISYRLARLDSAQAFIDSYLEVASSLGDTSLLAKGYFHQARIYKEQSRFMLALHYTRLSLDRYLELDHGNGIYANYNVLGNIYSRISEYDSAAFYFLKAIKRCEADSNYRNVATLNSNMVELFLQTGQYDQALKYANMAMEVRQQYMDDPAAMASSYMDLGRIASMQQRYSEAQDYYSQAYSYFQQANDPVSLLNVQNNLGDLYFRQGKYRQALDFFNKALDGYIALGDLHGIVTALGNKAAALNGSGRHEEALLLYDSCLNISLREGNRELRKDIYWNITRSSSAIGDYATAFKYYELYNTLNDSIFKMNKAIAINELEIIHEKERIMAKNQRLENENLRKDVKIKNRTIYLGSFLVVFLVVIFIVLYLRQRAVKDRVIAQQQVRQLEEEKKLMAARLLVEGQENERKRIARELHDGLGVLLSATRMQFTSIKDVSPENRPLIERAAQMLEQASGDVRKISHNMMPGLLTKLGLFEAVEDLFDNLNDNENLTASCNISGEPEERLPENKEIMIYRIVQELVNNTLKHAGATHISLDMNVTPEAINMVYLDNGKGFDVAKALDSETGSFGLRSLESRVGFLNGKMNYDSAPGEGVKVTIDIRL